MVPHSPEPAPEASSEPPCGTSRGASVSPPPPVRVLRTGRGQQYALPLFMPVYQSNAALFPLHVADAACSIDACMVNAYFLYKNRDTRRAFQDGLTLRQHVQFPRLLMTDSGAFQGFARKLLLSNRVIIKFQEQIQTDIASPLDLVTPPGDSRAVARQKMDATLKRVAEGLPLVNDSLLTGVQQGGRFPDLRIACLERLMELNCRYLALGSLVPFFTRNHDLTFVGKVIRDARQVAGDVPMHIYGAGDPVEIPLMVAMGADVFDSSSYVHFARRRFYMTPYGALPDPGPLLAGEYTCGCAPCRAADSPAAVFADEARLTAHNLWTICDTMRVIREKLAAGQLDQWIDHVLDIHMQWFPASRLAASWAALRE